MSVCVWCKCVCVCVAGVLFMLMFEDPVTFFTESSNDSCEITLPD